MILLVVWVVLVWISFDLTLRLRSTGGLGGGWAQLGHWRGWASLSTSEVSLGSLAAALQKAGDKVARPWLISGIKSILPYFIGQSRSLDQLRFKKWENRFYLLTRGGTINLWSWLLYCISWSFHGLLKKMRSCNCWVWYPIDFCYEKLVNIVQIYMLTYFLKIHMFLSITSIWLWICLFLCLACKVLFHVFWSSAFKSKMCVLTFLSSRNVLYLWYGRLLGQY